jgi:hypothetical protein
MTGIDINMALQAQLSERQRRKDLKSGVERIYSRRHIEQAILETFELIGGVSRLAMWANDPENIGEFYKIMMRLAPKEMTAAAAGQVIEYRSNIPASALNRGKVEREEDIAEGDFSEEKPE